MKSFKVLISLAAACCLAQYVVVNGSSIKGSGSLLISGQFYKIQYKQINKYLESKVNSYDVDRNLKAAQNYLDSELSSGVSISKRPLVEALKQFLALKQVANKCDMDAYAILYKNHKGSSAFAHKDESKFGPMRQIDNVIYQVAMEHAKKCPGVYEEAYESKHPTMDQDKLRAVKTFTNFLVRRRMKRLRIQKLKVFEEPKDELAKKIDFRDGVVNYLVNGRIGSLKDDGPIHAYKALKSLTRSTPESEYLVRQFDADNKLVLDKAKVVELFDKYIVESCKYYVNEVSSIFEPAKFDAMWHYPDRAEYTPSYENFLRSWGSYEVCKRLIKKDRNSVLKGVLYIAKKRANTSKN